MPNRHPLTPDDFRLNAEKCRWLATLGSHQGRRDACLDLAETWDEMATRREINDKRRKQIRNLIKSLPEPAVHTANEGKKPA